MNNNDSNDTPCSSSVGRMDFSDAHLRAPALLASLLEWSLELDERRTRLVGRLRNMVLEEASRAKPGDLLSRLEVDLGRRLDDRERDSLVANHHQVLMAISALHDSGGLTHGHIRRVSDGILSPAPAPRGPKHG